MSSQNYVNAADIYIQHKRPENTSVNNDMKEKFIKYKSKELVFFSGENNFPEFSLFPDREYRENLQNLDDFPKKTCCLFDEFNDNEHDFPSKRNGDKIVHSNLFEK